jgi:hypothetical protein
MLVAQADVQYVGEKEKKKITLHNKIKRPFLLLSLPNQPAKPKRQRK